MALSRRFALNLSRVVYVEQSLHAWGKAWCTVYRLRSAGSYRKSLGAAQRGQTAHFPARCKSLSLSPRLSNWLQNYHNRGFRGFTTLIDVFVGWLRHYGFGKRTTVGKQDYYFEKTQNYEILLCGTVEVVFRNRFEMKVVEIPFPRRKLWEFMKHEQK